MPIALLLLVGTVAVVAVASASKGSGASSSGKCISGAAGALPPVPTTPTGNVVITLNGTTKFDTAGKYWVSYDPKTTAWASLSPKFGKTDPFCLTNAQYGLPPTPKPNGTIEPQKPLSEACRPTITLGKSGVWWNGQVFFESFQPTKSDGFFDELTSFVTDTVVPLAIKILAIVQPEIGLPIAGAYALASQIIQGAPMKQVLATAIADVKAQLGPDTPGAALLQQGVDTVQKNAPGALNAIDAVQKALKSSGLSADELKAFQTGVSLAQSAQIQEKATGLLRNMVPKDKQAIFDSAIDNGAPLSSLAWAFLPAGHWLPSLNGAIKAAASAVNPKIPASAFGSTQTVCLYTKSAPVRAGGATARL